MRLAAFFILLFCGIAHAQTTVPGQLLTAPSASGQIYNSQGASHLWNSTATPTFGAAGTLGSLTLGNATSGLGTLQPATGALGTTTWLLPALGTTDTITTNAATQTLTNKTISSATSTITLTTATKTSGITSGDLLSSVSNLLTDTGTPAPVVASTYWYPYGLGNAGCFSNATCTVPTGQTVPGGLGVYAGSASNTIEQLWDSNNRTVSYSSVPRIDVSLNEVGIENGNSTISGTISGKTFSVRFSGASITSSPQTVTYTGTGGDTAATAATSFCNAVIANTNVTNATTQMVCDANQGGGGFNLQWSVAATITTLSVGTGTVTLTGPYNLLDGIFVYHVRSTPGYANQAGDTLYCDEYPAYQACQYVRENVANSAVTTELRFDVAGGAFTLGISEGLVVPCLTGTSPAYAGLGTIDICNSTNGGSLYFAKSTGAADARIFENSGGSLIIEPGTADNIVFFTAGGVGESADYNFTHSGSWTFSNQVYLTNQAGSGGNAYVCVNSSTGELSFQSSC